MGAAVEQHLEKLWETPKTLHGVLGTVDHKELGRRYITTALTFLLIGGLEALMIRIQLARAETSILTPEMYDQLFTMHGMTMIFWYASPILSGFAVFLVPLMIGARDLAYPRLNAFTYWTFLLSGVMLYVAPFLGQAPHAGWFSYVPYTNALYSPSLGIDFYNYSLLLLTISTLGGAINFIVTILRLRAPGMSVSRMPLFLYSTLTVSFISVFALPSLTAANIILELDRQWHTHFFNVSGAGSPLLWQNVFWFFGHPWVYIIFLPATGMISMMVPVFSRRPIVGYSYVAASTILTGVVGFGVWVHHMFSTGMNHLAMSFFSAASMTISVFTIVQVFAWMATIWKGRPVRTAAMHYVVGFIALIIVGGLDGVATAVLPLDWQLNDTYWVISHIHYVLVGANMFPVFAAIYYWVPKMTGRMMNERLGKISFWVMFVGFNLAFFTMHLVGVQGMPRRIYTYPRGLGWESMNLLITIGAFVLAFGILLTLINFLTGLKGGEIAPANPWNADSLEWATDSPPASYNFARLPAVRSRHPLWDDFDENADPHNERLLERGRLTFTTSWLDGEAYGATRIPKDTVAPLGAAVGISILLGALVFKAMWLALGALIFSLLVIGFWMWPHAESERA